MEGQQKERRLTKRIAVPGGNAEILSVFGRGRRPKKRVRLVDWSAGGVLLRVESPSRRFMLKQDPALFEMDTVTCCLRLPPVYKAIPVSGTVVHVERDPDDASYLKVGVAFDDDIPAKYVREMVQILEKRPRQSSRVGRVSSRSGRIVSGRLHQPSGSVSSSRLNQKAIAETRDEAVETEPNSRQTDRLHGLTDSEQRILEKEAERSKSRRLAKSAEAAQAPSQPIPAKVTIVPTESQRAAKQSSKSQRLKRKTGRLKKAESQRLQEKASQRLNLTTDSEPLLMDSGSEGLTS